MELSKFFMKGCFCRETGKGERPFLVGKLGQHLSNSVIVHFSPLGHVRTKT